MHSDPLQSGRVATRSPRINAVSGILEGIGLKL